jgi:adenylate cyclase
MGIIIDTLEQDRARAGVASRPDYEISVEPAGRHMSIKFGGETIADSNDVLVLQETRLPDTYYFPRADVRMDLLEETGHHTHCPFKGNANYWSIVVGDERSENAAWAYESAYEESAALKDHIAFYMDRVSTFHDDAATGEITHETLPSHANPIVEWLLREAWEALTSRELLARFCRRLVEAGIPVSRGRVLLRTLHPQLFANGYAWNADTDAVEKWEGSYEILEGEQFQNSPFIPIIEGAGGVRRRLEGPNPVLDFPVLEDLHADGATDYVALPLTFSNGQINILTMASHTPGGFSTSDLGMIHEILPSLSRLFEVHALHRTSATLLKTFLGRHTGEQVLRGRVKRGDGEKIHAVIWFCDLRGSTPLAESMPMEDFLEHLNRFFDCLAGAVIDHGGEVLRFVGDAVLAIFPIGDSGHAGHAPACNAEEACVKAITAARDAQQRVADLNSHSAETGLQPIAFGIGLHVGDLMYGNIGVPQRLEFTVIGPAANEAARIEDLTKSVGHPILISSELALHYPGSLKSIGDHPLRGVEGTRRIYTLPDDA